MVVVVVEVVLAERVSVEVMAVAVLVEEVGMSTKLKLAGRGITSSKSLGFSHTDSFVTLL